MSHGKHMNFWKSSHITDARDEQFICAFRTSHVTYIKKLRHRYAWVMSCIWLFMSWEQVISHTRRCHVTRMNESCHAYNYLCVQNRSCHTCKETTLHVCTSHVMHVVICAFRTSDFTRTKRSRYTYERVMSCKLSFVHWDRVTLCYLCSDNEQIVSFVQRANCMSDVTRSQCTNELCHLFIDNEWRVVSFVHWDRVMSLIRRSCITRMDESCQAYSYSRVQKECCHSYEGGTLHLCISHGIHIKESWHIHEGVTSRHAYEWVTSHTFIRHVTHANKSCHTSMHHAYVMRGGFD